MNVSAFSNEQVVTLPVVAPAAPSLDDNLAVAGRGVTLTVHLPATAVDGGPLPGPMHLRVFYKPGTFAGSTPAAELAADTPSVSVDLTAGQQSVEVTVPDLTPGQTYFFVASCEALCLT